jgi:hypothetical protein
VQDKPPNDSDDQPVEAWRVLRVWMDEGVERGVDQRPILGAGVLLWLGSRRPARDGVRRPAGGLGGRLGVQVGQMLGAVEQRSERIVNA